MKLTDLAIVFQLFFLCIITVLHIRSTRLHALQISEIMHDNVMDGIVEDSLRAGYKSIDITDGRPWVELSDVKECFKAEVNLYKADTSYVLIYVDCDGFYILDSHVSEEWSEKINFSNLNQTLHEQKIYELTYYIEHQLGIVLNIPYNSGESFMNTIDDYSLIAITYNKNYDVKSFSGAKIHKRNIINNNIGN